MKTSSLIFIGLLFIANACPDQDPLPDSEIKIINNSDITILHLFNSDTLLPEINHFSTNDQIEYATINPNASSVFPGFYKDHFSRGYDELILFLFKRETVISNDWETIRSQHLVAKRYDLTLSILDSLDWTITYP